MHVDLSWWKTCTSCSTCFPAPPSRGLWVLLVRPELVSAFHVWSWMVQESTHMWYLPWTLWRPLHVKKSIPVTSPILVVWFNLYLIFSRIDNCNNAHSGCIAGFVFLMLQETNRLYQWATPKSRGWSSIVPLKLPVTKPTAGVLARVARKPECWRIWSKHSWDSAVLCQPRLRKKSAAKQEHDRKPWLGTSLTDPLKVIDRTPL